MQIIKNVLGWIYRHFISFLIIVVILVIGTTLRREYESYKSTAIDIEVLERADAQLTAFAENQKRTTIDRVNGLKQASVKKLDEGIQTIEERIATLNNSKCSDFAFLRNFKQCLIIGVKSDIEIAILDQEIFYLQQLRARGAMEVSKKMCGDTLVELAKAFLEAHKGLENNELAKRQLRKKFPNKFRFPGTWIHKEYERLSGRTPRLRQKSEEREKSYIKQKEICQIIHIPGKIAFTISNIEVDKARAPLSKALSNLREKLASNWWNKLLQPIRVVIPTALKMLAVIIFTPLTIKAILYFVIAPLASRRTSNCLIPETSGVIDQLGELDETQITRIDISNAAKEINLANTDELLIHPEYLQIIADGGSKDTKWLLDYKFPLSSIASRMFALTRFRPDSESTCVVSAMEDPLSKVAVIVIPAGSAIVLHPRSLVGIVQHRDRPVTITRHWRLTSLHAWLTLQLRYLVFHGPIKLIVEGSHGVSIGKAGRGLSINQAATIGFSANLSYATTRSQTFVAYLTGKQELFNDYFPSGPGYFIYEEKPLFGKKTGIVFGRGPEGIVDSILKVFGV